MKHLSLAALLFVTMAVRADAQQPVLELDTPQCNWTWSVYLPPPLNIFGIPTVTDQFQIVGRVGGPFVRNTAGIVYEGQFTTGEITMAPDLEGYFPDGVGGVWATYKITNVLMRKESLPLDFGVSGSSDGTYSGDHWFNFISGTADIHITNGGTFTVPLDGLDSLPQYQQGAFTSNPDGSLHFESSEVHAFLLFDPTSSLTFDLSLSGDIVADEIFDITTYCSGDGSGTACPCGNAAGADEGCMNGTGMGGQLTASGTASAGANSLVLQASNLVPSQPGLYFQGNNATGNAAGITFGDGLRCAGGGVIRLQVRFADTTGSSNSSIDIPTSGGVLAGQTKRYQVWYRDPNSTPCGLGFNLTNGIEVVWGA
jgi:hypothetical protein